MKKYSHTWLGLGLLFFLLALLAAILPSRTDLLQSKYTLPVVTWTEMPVQAPKVEPPPPLSTPEQPAGSPASKSPAPVPPVEPTAPPAAPPEKEPKPGAFTLDFGPFVTAREADEMEARLNQLGASTIRFRKRSTSALYTLKIGEFKTPAQAEESMEQLRLRHPTLPLGKLEPEGGEQFTIAVNSLYPLREAVALAGRLETEGFTVRIKTARGGAPVFTLRLGKTYDLKTAQEKNQEFRNQGLPSAIVPVGPAPSP